MALIVVCPSALRKRQGMSCVSVAQLVRTGRRQTSAHTSDSTASRTSASCLNTYADEETAGECDGLMAP